MIRKFIVLITLGVTLSGCFMAPLALIGPATSGFSTASIMQAGASSGINYMVKQSTGKTLSEHAITTLTDDILRQTYLPKKIVRREVVAP